MVALLSTLALAGSLTLDLDGDGKPETVTAGDEAVTIGAHAIPCGGYGPCDLVAHDVSSADPAKEVALCEHGPRDDAYCELYTLRGGQVVAVPFEGGVKPPKIVTNGTGIVLTEHWEDRIYQRIEKYVARDGALVRVPQPAFAAEAKVHVEKTFPLYFAPGGAAVVANAKPESDVVLLVEHGEQADWYLVKLSSGITGWAKLEAIVAASLQLQAVMGAG